ncbi:MAG TPA: TetR/AcrR family transcriptional regulator [Actinospica sp.]|jgi:AcrR family transcriptional regulator|nr:TetR/AcrR family transcriptional regulator [Actinospica sp.]
MLRDRLLDSAETVLAEHGTQGLTLAAVAAHAGVSKGGLLYHFATKDALITGLIERLIDGFDALIADLRAERVGWYTRAYIEATFTVLGERDVDLARRRWAAVCAAATDPALRAPLAKAQRRWMSEGLDEEPDPDLSQLARLAADGVWEAAELDPSLLGPGRLAALHRRLVALVPETASVPEPASVT